MGEKKDVGALDGIRDLADRRSHTLTGKKSEKRAILFSDGIDGHVHTEIEHESELTRAPRSDETVSELGGAALQPSQSEEPQE